MATPSEKLARYERKEQRRKVEEQQLFGSFLREGTGALTATGLGALFSWNPRLTSFDRQGRVGTRPVIGAITFLGAVALDPDEGGDLFEGLTNGILMPWFAELGARAHRSMSAPAEE